MATLQSTQPAVAPMRQSKRKRAAVNYCEEQLSEDDLELDDVDFDDDDDESTSSHVIKKQKIQAPRPLPKRKIFPFLDLPAEIRNQIYKLCLTDPLGIYLCPTTYAFRRTVQRVPEAKYRMISSSAPDKSGTTSDDTDEGSDSEDQDKAKDQYKPSQYFQPLVPALLATNKQIYQEGREMLYGNDFYMGDTMTMHAFLVDIGARAASLLKSVFLIHWGEGRGVNKAYNHAAFTALSSATNLEKFVMHGHNGSIYRSRSAPKHVATQFYRDAFPWLEAVGTAKGKADAAVDLVNFAADSFLDHSRRRWWRTNTRYEGYDQIDSFRQELAKLLNARMNRIRS
ncbi:hypothetical protein DM02DRAFT_613634 [Periconia macrospinosa]|uniref:F-box domain-containing protein n=1 Tax=Periconia macrospinosa TaxID=97972 RepID=A0A2V1DTV6_9PLEO|nr:hypothetical protein DM02DRAFT_613634 [Periconia macrospinosa]